MRILVVSDTHGQCERVYKVYKKLVSEAPVDVIVHCGDYSSDALEIQARLRVHVAWVKGNCDGCFDDYNWSILETEFGNFLITHGHMENVDFSQQNLYYKILENDCVGGFYGHTHRSAYTQVGDVYLMNPGSLTRPRDGSGGTFGLVVTSEDSIWGKIYRYEDFMAEENADGSPESTASASAAADGVPGSTASASADGAPGSPSSAAADKTGQPKKPKVKGGKLRDLLNYSDRF